MSGRLDFMRAGVPADQPLRCACAASLARMRAEIAFFILSAEDARGTT